MSQFEKTISALKSEIDSAVYMGHSYKDCVPVSILQDAVNQLSDHDRVKVVRCRQCRFWVSDDNQTGMCFAQEVCNYHLTDGDWFCADGEWEG